MHELPITQSILNIALRHARDVGATHVTNIYLVIGKFSYVMDDSVQFYWDVIARDTIAEGARLHFQRVPAQFFCLDCSHRYSPNGETLACPRCRSTQVKVVAGDEFRLDSIDVEMTASPAPTLLEK